MIEEWKLLKQTHYKRFTFSYYISNFGRVKLVTELGEEILEIGKGLTVKHIVLGDKHYYELMIIGMSYCMYHLVWNKFMYERPKGYQIHHKDFNHYNNRLDNLECLDPKEHGLRHKWQSYLQYDEETLLRVYPEYKDEYYKWKKARKIADEYKKISEHRIEHIHYWKTYIANIKQQMDEILRNEYDERLKLREQKQKEKEILIQQERQRKVDSGEYYVNDKGKLVKKHIVLPKWTDERRIKTMNIRKEIDMYNSPEWRKNVSIGTRLGMKKKKDINLKMLKNIK